MANTTNYNWETPDDTDLVKDGAAAIRTLGSSIDTTTKALNPETTLGDIAYRSATSNTNTRLAIGSAGQVLTVAAGVPSWATPTDQTPLTTKGDVFTFSTVDARLGVGANGTVLTADSAETTGLKWAAPSGFVGCQMYIAGTSTSITQNAYVVLNGWTEHLDTDAFHSTVTNTSRITIPSGLGGKYRIYQNVNGSTNWGTATSIKVYKNGADPGQGLYDGELQNNDVSNRPATSGTAVLDLIAGDYIEFNLRTNVATGNYAVYAQFGVERLAS